MARRTTCGSLETSNETISIKKATIKSSRAKVIRIYEAGGTGCYNGADENRKFNTAKFMLFTRVVKEDLHNF